MLAPGCPRTFAHAGAGLTAGSPPVHLRAAHSSLPLLPFPSSPSLPLPLFPPSPFPSPPPTAARKFSGRWVDWRKRWARSIDRRAPQGTAVTLASGSRVVAPPTSGSAPGQRRGTWWRRRYPRGPGRPLSSTSGSSPAAGLGEIRGLREVRVAPGPHPRWVPSRRRRRRRGGRRSIGGVILGPGGCPRRGRGVAIPPSRRRPPCAGPTGAAAASADMARGPA